MRQLLTTCARRREEGSVASKPLSGAAFLPA